MSRYIDAEWLGKHISYVILRGEIQVSQIIRANRLDDAPSIDIVRCKECKYKDMELCAMYKLVVAGVRKYDDFCSYGEREGE